MNEHDSEKVSGVLLGRGYRAVENPMQADLVLYNTCSIRERAAQKVFARLGDWKTVGNGKIIGVDVYKRQHGTRQRRKVR